MKVLVVVDMQNDFVSGALGTPEAQSIVPNVVKKIEEYYQNGNRVYFTQDTHDDNYLNTEEGKNLPVPHCLENTPGCKLIPSIEKYFGKPQFQIKKSTFGSIDLVDELLKFNTVACIVSYRLNKDTIPIESIELIGLCTDICVISNAIIAKSSLPNVPIYVDASCCAGTTPEAHDKAIDLMKNSLQIHILNEGKEPWRK